MAVTQAINQIGSFPYEASKLTVKPASPEALSDGLLGTAATTILKGTGMVHSSTNQPRSGMAAGSPGSGFWASASWLPQHLSRLLLGPRLPLSM